MGLLSKKITLLLIVVAVSSLCAGCAMNSSQNRGTIYETWLNTGDMTQQLTAGTIDAFVAWEPITSTATVGGMGTALARSETIWPGHPCCVLVGSRTSLEELDRNAVLGMAWAHVRATLFINDPQNYDDVVEGVAISTGVNGTTASESLKHITYTDEPSVQDAREIYYELENASLLKQNVSTLGYSSVDSFLNSSVDPTYVKEVKMRLSEDPNWTPPSSNTTINLGLLADDSHKLANVIAAAHNYYGSVGLHLKMRYYSNGPALVEGLKSGDVDLGYCGIVPVLLKAINNDIRTTVIAAANADGSALIVRAPGGIHALSDLGGQTIGVPGSGTVQDLLLRRLAAQQRLSVETK